MTRQLANRFPPGFERDKQDQIAGYRLSYKKPQEEEWKNG
jgi:hypothetical protein